MLQVEAANDQDMAIRIRHFLGLFARWVGTVLFTALIVATVKIYQTKGSFSSAHKAAFNTIMVALTLLLGLNFFVSASCANIAKEF